MKYLVSWGTSFLSSNWKEKKFDTEEEANGFASKKMKQHFVVLPTEEVDDDYVVDGEDE